MNTDETSLNSKLTVRTNPYQPQRNFIGLLINQNQIWFDVTITMIFPLAREWMIPIANFQCLIISKAIHNGKEFIILNSSVGQAQVCVFSTLWQGVTTRQPPCCSALQHTGCRVVAPCHRGRKTRTRTCPTAVFRFNSTAFILSRTRPSLSWR